MPFNSYFRYAPYAFFKRTPLRFSRGNNFILQQVQNRRIFLGGACCLTLQTENSAHTNYIAPALPGRNIDYFFPWIDGGIGACHVPRAARKGTIVCTDEIQGCSIKVFINLNNPNNLTFIHDHNNNTLDHESGLLLGIANALPPLPPVHYQLTTDNVIVQQDQMIQLVNANANMDIFPPPAPPNFHSFVYFVKGSDFWFVSVSHVWADGGRYYGNGHGPAPGNLNRMPA